MIGLPVPQLDGKDIMSWYPNKELGKEYRDPEPAKKNV